MHQPLHNSHFLLLQVFFPAVANWLQLRSYICIQVSVSANLWNPEANLQCTRLGIVVLPLKVVAYCSTACGLPQNSMGRYLSVSHCCQNDAIYHNLPPSTTNRRGIRSKLLKEEPLYTLPLLTLAPGLQVQHNLPHHHQPFRRLDSCSFRLFFSHTDRHTDS